MLWFVVGENLAVAIELDRDRRSLSGALPVLVLFLDMIGSKEFGIENFYQPAFNIVKGGSLGGVVLAAGLDQGAQLGAADFFFEVVIRP